MTVHGATDQRPPSTPGDRERRARNHRRRLAARLGFKLSELDVITSELLASWARKRVAIDELEPGELRIRAENAADRALRDLVARLRELGLADGKRREPSLAELLAAKQSNHDHAAQAAEGGER